ncbi:MULTISPECIES: LysR family transcriptional regulator [unclassified Bosea (in: a-proteobacteria)]|uniref:LysR family transcriptional regulator n=1 Tax=unclassified Bosea (in: a-proteobacteria) TaxID=2653178 RepID=UPI000F75D532|nr:MULTISPECIES: LysR family transcriptional regulator [unclassified Bosea (in: a-proteobacteria)]AZO78527.1 LysR family transcriptional regulator [Bosea sp. Tri-49]RXT19980.1 LysR family transcriptional regulator [Bosea sp. Tri-39]RXT36852.1 LysR family transcriptional regulator [Bosea sp. Tri-54]
MLTLRQIEVVRAIMITGTIAGAAKLLNVSAPGISRLMKHTERTLRLKLFDRRHGRYVPTPEAKDIFEQINGVYRKVDDLHSMLARIERGGDVEFKLGSVPSICHVMVPRAIERLRRKHPDLRIDINILKIEEALDYLLLGKGEIVAMSYKLDHPGLDFMPLAMGELLCIVPQSHPLAGRTSISAREIVQHPLIGIDPTDPYGRIMSEIFERQKLRYEMAIKARFGTTVCSLVRAGLGIAIIDQFTVAHGSMQGIATIPIEEPTHFQTYVAMKNDKALSLYAETFVRLLREEMTAVISPRLAAER